MGNDTADCRELGLQAIFNLVHDRMHVIDWFRRLETAMIMDEQALIVLADSDIVDAAEAGLFLGQRKEQGGDGLGKLDWRISAGKESLRLRLNMAFNLNITT